MEMSVIPLQIHLQEIYLIEKKRSTGKFAEVDCLSRLFGLIIRYKYKTIVLIQTSDSVK